MNVTLKIRTTSVNGEISSQSEGMMAMHRIPATYYICSIELFKDYMCLSSMLTQTQRLTVHAKIYT